MVPRPILPVVPLMKKLPIVGEIVKGVIFKFFPLNVIVLFDNIAPSVV